MRSICYNFFMITAQDIISLCWILFLLYWFISWQSVKPTEEMRWGVRSSKWVIILIFIIIFFSRQLGLASFLSLPRCHLDWRGCHFGIANLSPDLLTQVISVIITVSGLTIAIIARKTLAGNWSNNIEFKKGHELITRGIYGYMRHPIYTGVLLMGFGTMLLSGTPVLFLSMLAMTGFCILKLTQEEKLLTKHFPKEYPTYKKRVKALIPYIL
jgi:protein-S-isoprenylcysteine O-methyltransferase Ste14